MTRKVLVGMLLLGALFVFGLSTFYVKNWQFYVGKGYRLRANFPVVHTLDEGDVVRMAGVSVGTVQELEIDTEAATRDPVRSVLWIRAGVDVRADDVAIIKLASVFGGNYVAIERGDPTARVLLEGDQITRTEAAPSVTEVVEQSKATLSEIQKAFEDLTAITTDLSEGRGTLGRLLKDEEFFNQLDRIRADAGEAMAALKVAGERLEKGEGVLGRLLMDDDLAADIDGLVGDATALAENMRAISEDVRDGEGTIGKLFASDELYTKLNDSFDAIADVAGSMQDGEGILPRLLDDAEMADEVRKLLADAGEAAANLKEITAEVRDGENTIGKLLASDEAYQKLDAALGDLKEFTSALAEGEGTLGKLVKDDEAYKQMTQLLASVQGIVDTYREQSPVISFAGAVFGAF